MLLCLWYGIQWLRICVAPGVETCRGSSRAVNGPGSAPIIILQALAAAPTLNG